MKLIMCKTIYSDFKNENSQRVANKHLTDKSLLVYNISVYLG